MANRLGIRGRTVDLYVQFVDATGNPTNTDNTPKVKIIDSDGTVRRSFSTSGVSLLKDPGLYKLEYTIPANAPDSYWTDVWDAEIGSEQAMAMFEFHVISSGVVSASAEPIYEPGDDYEFIFTKEETLGINKLLKILKKRLKNDGVTRVDDGNGGYVEKACPVFKDSELICFLVNGLSEFNSYPHFTNYTFADEQIQGIFMDIIIQGALILALAAQALIEKGREFSISDNGVTFQPPQVADMLNTQYSAQLADYKEKLKMIKCNLKPGPLGLGTFRVTSIAPAYLRLRHLREKSII